MRFTSSRDALQLCRFLARQKVARHFHLEDRFTWSTTEQNDFASVLGRNTTSEGKTKTGALLFSFADEGLEEALANPSGTPAPLSITFTITCRSRTSTVTRTCAASAEGRTGLAGVEQ